MSLWRKPKETQSVWVPGNMYSPPPRPKSEEETAYEAIKPKIDQIGIAKLKALKEPEAEKIIYIYIYDDTCTVTHILLMLNLLDNNLNIVQIALATLRLTTDKTKFKKIFEILKESNV